MNIFKITEDLKNINTQIILNLVKIMGFLYCKVPTLDI